MVNEYLAEVKANMSGIPADERDELLQFYEEQMMDAGLTTDEIVAKYGSPKQFARTLKVDYFIESDNDAAQDAPAGKRTKNLTMMILLIVLGLFASPILIPLAIVVVVGIMSVLAIFLMILAGIYMGIVGALAGGLFMFVLGIGVLMQAVGTGIFYMGLGIALTAAVIFFTPLVWAVTKALFEMFVTFLKWIGRRFLSKKHTPVTEG